MATSETQKPNSGAAVSDIVANGDDNESQTAWINKQDIDTDKRIKLTKLSHMRYQHPNLDEINQFLIGKYPIRHSPVRTRKLKLRHRLWNGSRKKNRQRDLVPRLWQR